MSNDPILVLYHGGQRWKDPPQVMPSRPNSYECGPGIYTTVNAATAAKYAKGSGVITEVHLSPDINWLEDATVKYDDALAFLLGLSRVPGRKDIKTWLDENARRTSNKLGQGVIHANVLLNLMVNAQALGGQNGPRLAQWYADQGIDASLYNANGQAGWEDWVVIFNPKIILAHHVLKQSDIDWANPAQPGIREQLLNTLRPRLPREKMAG